MSHAVVRGVPFASQLYLDGVLDEVLRSGGSRAKGREGVSLPQILFHCLRKNPHDVFMERFYTPTINAATGEKIINSQIFKKAVYIARILISKGARGKNVMIVMRNDQTTAAVYFANLFAGSVPFVMIPGATFFENTHFLKIIEPWAVFCDKEHYNDLSRALHELPFTAEVIVSDWDELGRAMNGFSGADDFEIPDVDLDATVMMLPTGGSSGFPRVVLYTHRGLINQLPIIWSFYTQFPKPSDFCLLLSPPQRSTYARTVLSCVLYQMPLLMSPRESTVDWVKEMLVTYRPSWVFFGSEFSKSLLPTLTKSHLSSLRTLILLGAPTPLELWASLKEKLPQSASLIERYGATEAHGTLVITERQIPLNSGWQIINNTYDYKLINESGKEVGPGQNGELCFRGIIKGYYKNEQANYEVFEDGWYKTGDWFHIGKDQRLSFLKRMNFSFKFQIGYVSLEETEMVIESVPGVQECVVSCTERGSAALLVVSSPAVTRERVHNTVNGTLSEHKWLHGGIAFVSSLPRTHSGKLLRSACKTLVQDLVAAGECF